MDWSRAKLILIAAFLCLNLFLGYQLWLNEQSNSDVVIKAQNGIEELEQLLAARQISIEGNIPIEAPNMNNLKVRFADISQVDVESPEQELSMDGLFIESTFPSPVPLPEALNGYQLEEELSEYIWKLEEYRYEPTLNQPGYLVFIQMNDGQPFFNATVELYVENGQITGYQQKYFHINDRSPGRKIIPAFTAIRTLIENDTIQNGSVIHSIELGHYGQTYDADIQVLAPVWRVIYRDQNQKKIHYVNGITGAIEADRPEQTQTQELNFLPSRTFQFLEDFE